MLSRLPMYASIVGLVARQEPPPLPGINVGKQGSVAGHLVSLFYDLKGEPGAVAHSL